MSGKIIFFAGLCLVVVGIIIWQFSDKFAWFGNLPGDIKVEKENFRLYVPLASMFLISLALTLVFYIVRKIFQ